MCFFVFVVFCELFRAFLFAWVIDELHERKYAKSKLKLKVVCRKLWLTEISGLMTVDWLYYSENLGLFVFLCCYCMFWWNLLNMESIYSLWISSCLINKNLLWFDAKTEFVKMWKLISIVWVVYQSCCSFDRFLYLVFFQFTENQYQVGIESVSHLTFKSKVIGTLAALIVY